MKCKVDWCDNKKLYRDGYCGKHHVQILRHGKIIKETRSAPNEFVFENDICKIALYKKQRSGEEREFYRYAIIDKEDYDKIKNYKWFSPKERHPRVSAHINGKNTKLHRLLLGFPEHQIDHINGDAFDNRKSNLRICNNTQNCRNAKRGRNNTSGFKGVTWFKRDEKWKAQITVNRKNLHLGYFDDKVDAAKAYNEAAIRYHGEFARLNNIQ